MKNFKEIRLFGILLILAVFLFFFLIPSINLFIYQSNSQKTSFLQASNGGQDYWPTDGWLLSSPREQGMSSNKLAKMHDYIEEETINIQSVIVVRNGYIVDEGYLTNCKFRAVKEDYSRERHIMYSVTKSITSLCIGMAIKKGYIDNLSQTFFEFFPELWNPSYDLRKKNITIEHLLTMTSGIEWEESSIPYGSATNDYTQMIHTSNYVQYYLDKPVEHDPGSEFEYSAGSSILLSSLIQKITGQTTSDFARENLFLPLGLIDEHWRWNSDPTGITDGADGLYMTPRDMAKIGIFILNNGTWEGEEIVPKNYILTATINQPPNANYGYQFWIQEWLPYYTFAAMGWGGQRIFVTPELNMIVVFTAVIMGDPNSIIFPIMEEFILAAIGVDLENPLYGYPLVIIWCSTLIGFLGAVYLVNKKRRHNLDI
jgi:CubicO group peptidase (beta-lactamase class C family)